MVQLHSKRYESKKSKQTPISKQMLHYDGLRADKMLLLEQGYHLEHVIE